MNATVERIVQLMFEDLMPSEEVHALHDEVLANCQERYEDCLNRGMTEDEAIGMVVESLKGMDEVLAPYPKMPSCDQPAEEPQQYNYQREDGNVRERFSGSIDHIRVALTGDDVTLITSPDDAFYVDYTANSAIATRLDGRTLVVEHRKNQPRNENGSQATYMQDSAFGGFGQMFNRFLNSIHVDINTFSGGKATIAVPAYAQVEAEINTTSGNIQANNVQLRQLKANTTSGDVELQLASMERIAINTASGDIELDCNCSELRINTMSGDVEYRGSCPQAQINTVSGDLDANGCISGAIKTVSGDVDMTVASGSRLNIATTSGDVDLAPWSEALSLCVNFHAVSGNLRMGNHANLGENSDIVVQAKSVSGNFKVH